MSIIKNNYVYKKIRRFIKKRFAKNYWQSSKASEWHEKRILEKSEDLSIFADIVCNQIKDLDLDVVIEVGTGAGGLINNISENLHNCNRFVGIDINKKQIDKNIKKYNSVYNVDFIHGDIGKYIQKFKLGNTVIIAQNTFPYFHKDELEELFLYISRHSKNFIIIVNGPIQNLYIKDSLEQYESDMKMYKHNFSSMFKSIGCKITIEAYPKSLASVVIIGKKIN